MARDPDRCASHGCTRSLTGKNVIVDRDGRRTWPMNWEKTSFPSGSHTPITVSSPVSESYSVITPNSRPSTSTDHGHRPRLRPLVFV
jgi:hypothetical protein